jgi:uracil-DNA glycosylase family 4
MSRKFAALQKDITTCRKCPRLVAWREEVAREKRRAYADETYWGRPVPSFGDEKARLLVWGLAPAAHGANRTGRMFTGDESGRWLFRALHKAGFASQAESTSVHDGMKLQDCLITASARCAPPANKLLPTELEHCSAFVDRELALLKNLVVVVALGKVGWDAYLQWVRRAGHEVPRPLPRFSHQAEVGEGLPHVLLGSYHPSQQNTFTGKLTEPMLDGVFHRARELVDGT